MIAPKPGTTSIHEGRPLVLQNTLMKISAKLLAKRLYTVHDHIVGMHQHGFRPSGSIYEPQAEVLRWLQRPAGTILFLDLKGAFDTTSRELMTHILTELNFHDTFLNLHKATAPGTLTPLLLNRLQTYAKIAPTRGVKQGDPASPPLFNIYTSFLSKLTLPDPPQQYADDTAFFLPPGYDVTVFISHLTELFNAMHLTINWSKTKAIAWNTQRLPNAPFDYVDEFKYLGLLLTTPPQAHDLPYTKMLQSVLNTIQRLPLTLLNPYIKATIYNVFLATKITHILRVLRPSPTVTDTVKNILRSLFGRRSADGKKYWGISIDTVTRPIAHGGLGITDISLRHLSLQLFWKGNGPLYPTHHRVKTYTNEVNINDQSAKHFLTWHDKKYPTPPHPATSHLPQKTAKKIWKTLSRRTLGYIYLALNNAIKSDEFFHRRLGSSFTPTNCPWCHNSTLWGPTHCLTECIPFNIQHPPVTLFTIPPPQIPAQLTAFILTFLQSYGPLPLLKRLNTFLANIHHTRSKPITKRKLKLAALISMEALMRPDDEASRALTLARIGALGFPKEHETMTLPQLLQLQRETHPGLPIHPPEDYEELPPQVRLLPRSEPLTPAQISNALPDTRFTLYVYPYPTREPQHLPPPRHPYWVYTDGSCSQQQKRAGAAAVGFADNLHTNGFIYAVRLKGTPTNNRAELHAIVLALLALRLHKAPYAYVYSDSKYAVDGLNYRSRPTTNADLWAKLRRLHYPNVSYFWIKAHANYYGNHIADALAKHAMANPFRYASPSSYDYHHPPISLRIPPPTPSATTPPPPHATAPQPPPPQITSSHPHPMHTLTKPPHPLTHALTHPLTPRTPSLIRPRPPPITRSHHPPKRPKR